MGLKELLTTPNIWSNQYSEVEEIELSTGSSEYYHVQSKLNGDSRLHLKKITRIQNPYLYHRYQIRKLEYQHRGVSNPEQILLHATGASNIPSIIQNNLDWRLVNRAKFGKGVSFSNCAIYANKECSRSNGDERAMILASVLVAKTHRGSYTTSLPLKGYDTTVGNNRVFVKYYDDEFYPAYVAYYRNETVFDRRRSSSIFGRGLFS